MPNLKPLKILIGVTGGITAYKIADLVSFLTKEGHEVRCLLTENAKQFVSPLVLETLSENPVLSALWGESVSGTEHIRLARWPDVFLIAPATANTIAKLALGMADDLLSTVYLATDLKKVRTLIAPAMNTVMYEKSTVQNHLQALENEGVEIISPAQGILACREVGMGKLPSIETLASAILNKRSATSQTLTGQNILITGGPTISRIDAVRYLTNPSTGKMACALADAAHELGAAVTLLLGKDKGVVVPQTPESKNFTLLRVETAQEMLNESLRYLPTATGVIACAAVMDYELVTSHQHKLKRTTSPTTLRLVPAPDVLKTLKEKASPKTWFLGFAAESENFEKNGLEKLKNKNVDYLFVNPIAAVGKNLSTGFASSTNAGTLYVRGAKKTIQFPLQSKEMLALDLLTSLSHLQNRRTKNKSLEL